jgi:hypothetical protein
MTLRLTSFALLLAACGLPPATGPDSPSSGEPPTDPDGQGPKKTGMGLPVACATSSTTAERLAVDLVFMFDRSDSMNRPEKWPPAVAGLEAFFADPASTGLSASLAYFCGNTGSGTCDALRTRFATPAVPLTALPAAPTFAASLAAQSFCNGTPTGAALGGALDYATSLAQPGHRGAIVLVTDGKPTYCGSIAEVGALAAARASSIPTYVIGVGSALENLDAIAQAGGTDRALLVTASDPDKVASDFQAALAQIRDGVRACSYALPAPEPGATLDLATTNVQLVTDGGTEVLPFDRGCDGGRGWRFDDEANPRQIVLCADACTRVRAVETARVDVVLGCATVVL